MKRSWLLLACVLSSLCFAQTTVKYALSGNYLVQFSGTHGASWYFQSQCIQSGGNVVKAIGGGSISYTGTVYGTVSFNGSGVAGTTLTTLSVFDQIKSNATVKITWSTDGTCVPIVNNGHAVFDAPTGQSQSGTYTINSQTGTGTVIISGNKWAQFQTTGAFASCASGGAVYVIPNTIMIQTLSDRTPPIPNLYGEAGIAEHKNEALLACP